MHEINISSAKSDDFAREFDREFTWLGDHVKKQQKNNRHVTFSILGHSLHKLDHEASIEGSSIFQDSEVAKSDEDNMDRIFEETVKDEEV